jgi:hypothetical protein
MVVVEEGHCRGYQNFLVEEEEGRPCLAHTSPQLDVSSSARKPSAGGGAFPKKVQGWRQFVLSDKNWASADCLHEY